VHRRPSRSVLVALVLALGLLFALAGCGTGEEEGEPAASPSPKNFPVTLTTPNGELTIPKRPARIISLSPTSTESLFAIGAGPQVVAVDDQSDYPATAPQTKLSGYTPNAEAIAGYRPDLVVLSGNENNILSALEKLGIPVLLHAAPDNLGGAYRQIEQLGVATGHRRDAVRLVARMRARIGALVRSAAMPERHLFVYHELSPDGYSATSKTFIGRVYRLLGLGNVADEADSSGSGYPQLSAEYLVAANPDLIVLADTTCCDQSAASVAARPGWDEITAVKKGAVVEVDDSVASRWGPRIVEFVAAVARALRETGS
jgi:iron complex transport system substrate-binding protein